MDRKKELKKQYMDMAIEGGVFQIRNVENGKIYVGTTKNFKTLNGQSFMLANGGHSNKSLQADWHAFGKDAFEIEILHTLKKKETGFFDEKRELKKLEEQWMNDLQPYGERGYN